MTTYVTQPWLPDRERLNQYIDGIYSRKLLTNNGPLVQTFTERLKAFLGVEHLLLVSNGTLALQIAYRALGIQQTVNGKPAEAITTPFSFVATASTLNWEGIKPVFCDIDSLNWCLDAERLGALVTPQTRAIVPVHVFGNSCDVEKIDQFARQHHLKVIYDGAHAFNVKYQDKSLLNWGDATTLSFHATKIFHSIEGGAIIFRNEEDLLKARELINFGITGPEQIAAQGSMPK
ncbi:DegT/DnrJ/EryC1/StrS family aminotransferase [Erwinia sp. E_sp_W01_6]|uniref:DegT/DnrJ/EryC1/StrS family aminotransferase n=1 Tax=unclassified Erwinia TaxID=2622719 RepID=UPI0030CCDBF5